MIGDKLASGAASATFGGPKLRFDEAEMRRDMTQLPAAAFIDKYMITRREYDLLIQSDGAETSSLTRAIEEHTQVIERLIEQDKREDRGLERECFIEPFVGWNASGRIIVTRDQPTLRKEQSKLALPRHLRTQKERLPTTGHCIRANVRMGERDISEQFVGQRLLFGPMSGTAICFKGYPTWICLDLAEVIGIIHKEDAEVVEEELEPLS